MFLPALVAGMGSMGSVLGAGSAILGAVGTIMGGSASQDAANYNARVNEMQAKVAETQAAAKSAELQSRTRSRVAQAEARVLGSGFDLGGSFNDYIEATGAHGTMDALSAIYEGNVRATGFRNAAAANKYEG